MALLSLHYGHSHSSIYEMPPLYSSSYLKPSFLMGSVQIPPAYSDHDRLLDFYFFQVAEHLLVTIYNVPNVVLSSRRVPEVKTQDAIQYDR